jgi:putative ABC transport system permease protein
VWTLTWKGLLANKARFLLTGLAVVLGTGFVAGALTFGDTLEQGFEELFTSIIGETDAVIRPVGTGASPDDIGVGDGGAPETLAPELVDEIVALDGVRVAEGEMQGVAILIGDDGEPIGQFGPPTLAFNALDNEELDPAELRSGRWPETAGEVAIDAGTANGQDWTVGDEVGVVLDGPLERAEVVGIFGLGELDNLAGASVVLLDTDSAADRLGTDGRYSRIYAAAAADTDPAELIGTLQSALGDDVEVLTAQEIADEDQAAVAPFVEIFSTVLLVFAVIALLVGGFLIFNTFTIVLAGRLKELALLRAVGAGQAQLLRSVLGEALLVGIVGGALGAAFGLVVAFGLRALLGVIGIELPGESLVILPRTIFVSVALGAVITVAASLVPARRAVQVPPVAALTEVAVAAPAGRGVVRNVLGVVLVLGGVGAMAATLLGDAGAASLGAGAVAVFLGVAALASLISRPLAGLLGWPAARAGMSGELARANAMRNPRRTAATASALMIGLALVSFVSIFAASLQGSIDAAIERSFVVDAFVQAGTASGVPAGVLDELDGLAETETVAPVRVTQLPIGERNPQAAVMAPDDVLAVFDFEALEGEVADIREGGFIVADGAAASLELTVGDEVTVTLPDGEVEVPVRAIIDGSGLDTSWILDGATFADGGGEATVFNVYVQFAEEVGAETGVAAVESALADFPQVQVFDQAGLAEAVSDQLDQLLGVVVALLALSVLVALLGIVNTLALSVVERTREIGLLRAVGMTRPQVRSMVRKEAVVVALLGAALGLALGIPFGAAFTSVEVFNIDTFVLPWGQLAAGLVAAIIAGLLAGLLPARRAARMDVLRALQAE